MLIVTILAIGTSCLVGGYLWGYETRTKEEVQEDSFWKEIDKHGL